MRTFVLLTATCAIISRSSGSFLLGGDGGAGLFGLKTSLIQQKAGLFGASSGNGFGTGIVGNVRGNVGGNVGGNLGGNLGANLGGNLGGQEYNRYGTGGEVGNAIIGIKNSVLDLKAGLLRNLADTIGTFGDAISGSSLRNNVGSQTGYVEEPQVDRSVGYSNNGGYSNNRGNIYSGGYSNNRPSSGGYARGPSSGGYDRAYSNNRANTASYSGGFGANGGFSARSNVDNNGNFQFTKTISIQNPNYLG